MSNFDNLKAKSINNNNNEPILIRLIDNNLYKTFSYSIILINLIVLCLDRHPISR